MSTYNDTIFKLMEYLGVDEDELRNKERVELINGVLTKLDLRDLNLSKIPVELFSEFNLIESLYLQNNNLREFDNLIFSKLYVLKRLNLAENSITDIPPDLLTNNKDLEFLNLSNNKIRFLPETLFENKPKLNLLYLKNNRIDKLPGNIEKMDLITIQSDFEIDENIKTKSESSIESISSDSQEGYLSKPTNVLVIYLFAVLLASIFYLIMPLIGFIVSLIVPFAVWAIVDENFNKQYQAILRLQNSNYPPK